MKPWTERKQIASALRNEHVRIGERELKDGSRLRGLYAAQDFAAGDYVGAFLGRVVSREELLKLHETDRPLFERITEYAVWHVPLQGHLYPEDLDAVGAHLINHSCGPNAKWAQCVREAMLVRAIAPIAAGAEITIHYGWMGMKAAYEKNWHRCACQAPFCTGTVELRVEIVDHGDGTGGPYLSPEEVARRFMADICNGTDAHELVMHRYGRDSLNMISGVEVKQGLDPAAFFEKLREGARTAISVAREAGIPEDRLRRIVRTYELEAAR